MPDGGAGAPAFHGRRKGRRLRAGRSRLMQDLLPSLRVPRPSNGATLNPRSLFDGPVDDVWLEIGFGGGEHLAAQAEARRDVGIIGCEPYTNGVAALLRHVERLDLETVRVFDDDARLLLPSLASASIGRVFVLFPDPWPKRRHATRRFIGPATLPELARVMGDGAELRVATDHPIMARWVLAHTAGHPDFRWCARTCRDWRERPTDAPATRYEEKARTQGARIVYLRFHREARRRSGPGPEQPSCAGS